MRLSIAFVAGLGAAALIIGALGSVVTSGARADCADAQREFSAWRAENPSAPLDASMVPSCANEDANAQLAMGVAYVGVLLAAAAASLFAWTKRAPTAP